MRFSHSPDDPEGTNPSASPCIGFAFAEIKMRFSFSHLQRTRTDMISCSENNIMSVDTDDALESSTSISFQCTEQVPAKPFRYKPIVNRTLKK